MFAFLNPRKKTKKARKSSSRRSASSSKARRPAARKAKKSGRSRTAHLRQFQARAAKAMRMHHKLGISLKAAWKRV